MEEGNDVKDRDRKRVATICGVAEQGQNVRPTELRTDYMRVCYDPEFSPATPFKAIFHGTVENHHPTLERAILYLRERSGLELKKWSSWS